MALTISDVAGLSVLSHAPLVTPTEVRKLSQRVKPGRATGRKAGDGCSLDIRGGRSVASASHGSVPSPSGLAGLNSLNSESNCAVIFRPEKRSRRASVAAKGVVGVVGTDQASTPGDEWMETGRTVFVRSLDAGRAVDAEVSCSSESLIVCKGTGLRRMRRAGRDPVVAVIGRGGNGRFFVDVGKGSVP